MKKLEFSSGKIAVGRIVKEQISGLKDNNNIIIKRWSEHLKKNEILLQLNFLYQILKCATY